MGDYRDESEPSRPPLPPDAWATPVGGHGDAVGVVDPDATVIGPGAAGAEPSAGAGRSTERGGPPAEPPNDARRTQRPGPPMPPGPMPSGAAPTLPSAPAPPGPGPVFQSPPEPPSIPAVPPLPSIPADPPAVAGRPGLPTSGPTTPMAPPAPGHQVGGSRDPSTSLQVPLLVLGVGVAVTVLSGVLQTSSFEPGVSFETLQLYLAWVGWPTAMLVGLAAGIAAVSRPISGRASAGLLTLGAVVAGLGLLSIASLLVRAGLGELLRALPQAIFGEPGAAIVVAVVAVIVARQATTPGPSNASVVVLALVVAAGLVGVNGAVQAVLGRLDFLGAAGRLALALGSFGFAVGALLLAAAIVLLLSDSGSELRGLVMAAAALSVSIGLLAQFVVAVSNVDPFIRSEVGGAVPAPALAALVVAYLSDRWLVGRAASWAEPSGQAAPSTPAAPSTFGAPPPPGAI